MTDSLEGVQRITRPTIPPPVPRDAHKGSMGKVLCIAGSPEMPGAAQLVLRAAQRGGAGLVALAVFQPELFDRVAPILPEAIYLDCCRSKALFAGRLPDEIENYASDVRVAGPGLNSSGRTRELVRRLVEAPYEGPLVLDADALNVLAGVPEVLTMSQSQVVLTPHPGEAERLLDRPIPSDEAGRIDCALELAQRSNAVCVLKGPHSIVTDGARLFLNPSGSPSLATAGSGDILAGLVGAYLAWSVRCQDPEFGLFEAVCSAVHVHGLAGEWAAREFGERGTIASDILQCLARAQKAFEESASSPSA